MKAHGFNVYLSPVTSEMTKVSYIWKAATAGLAALLVMTAFESVKALSFKQLTLWESHGITIAFTAALVFTLGAIFLRREQVKLNTSTALSDSLFESLPGVVCIFNASGIIRRWNSNFLG